MIRSINRVGGAAFAMIVDGEWHNTAKRAAMALAAKLKKSAPGAARTRNLLIRSQALCPIELRGQITEDVGAKVRLNPIFSDFPID